MGPDKTSKKDRRPRRTGGGDGYITSMCTRKEALEKARQVREQAEYWSSVSVVLDGTEYISSQSTPSSLEHQELDLSYLNYLDYAALAEEKMWYDPSTLEDLDPDSHNQTFGPSHYASPSSAYSTSSLSSSASSPASASSSPSSSSSSSSSATSLTSDHQSDPSANRKGTPPTPNPSNQGFFGPAGEPRIMHQKEWTEVLEAHRMLVPWVKGKVYRPEELEPIQTGPLEGEQQIEEQEVQDQPEDLDAEGEVLGIEEWDDLLANEEVWRVA
ncbi:uncharacterized protein MKK02DRAFT_28551 [Dioszegia hungarica]|uniref:Uncharacterized protein n=1 Tax=Dioszegia hungarica TaxID=4972 RepID=A0AA38H4U1_9TREE|nr:uncharacterized protein MKK02DRAFT_28551 [Dioszegia hungarica]KAI9633783.1 hypothetical protein MKK02DRAFT_28551 [Dioszegia hungarica]